MWAGDPGTLCAFPSVLLEPKAALRKVNFLKKTSLSGVGEARMS